VHFPLQVLLCSSNQIALPKDLFLTLFTRHPLSVLPVAAILIATVSLINISIFFDTLQKGRTKQ
jgi:hypothetical protein